MALKDVVARATHTDTAEECAQAFADRIYLINFIHSISYYVSHQQTCRFLIYRTHCDCGYAAISETLDLVEGFI